MAPVRWSRWAALVVALVVVSAACTSDNDVPGALSQKPGSVGGLDGLANAAAGLGAEADSITLPGGGPISSPPDTVLYSSLVVAEVNGAGAPEIVVATRNGKLHVVTTEPVLAVAPGWPQQLEAHLGSSPAVGDLDNDGVAEIVIGVGDDIDLPEGRAGEGSIVAFRPDGSRKWTYKTRIFAVTGESQVFTTPALGDINGDGFKDVVAASYNRDVIALDGRNGTPLPGWPVELVDTNWSSPSLVDLDKNGQLSVVLGSDFGWNGTPNLGCVSPPTNGLLVALNANGQHRPGYPKCLTTPIWSTPAVVDLLGDGQPVAVFGTNNFSLVCGPDCSNVGHDKVYAIRLSDGQMLPGFPVQLVHGPQEVAMSSPAVGDVDGDGTKEIAIGSNWGPNGQQGSLYLIERSGAIRWQKEFPFDTHAGPVLGDLDGDGKADVVVGNGDWNVYAYNGSGTSLGPGGAHLFHTDSFIKSSAALVDVDGNGKNDLVVASGVQNGPAKLWVIGTNGNPEPAANPWPMFKQNAARTGSDFVIVPPRPVRSGFDTELVLANPSAGPAQATVTLQLPAGAPIVQTVAVPPNGRTTVKVDEIHANTEVSAKVESTVPLVAERSMYFKFGPGWTGGHTTHGATAPATDWFLAEGYTAPNFDCFILVQNPNASPVDATITLLPPGGGATDVPISVPAQSRRTLSVKDVPGFQNSEVSFRVQATGPVVVERSMYFDYNGNDGGHDVVGVTSLAQEWFLAEGFTGGSFDTFVLVANPNDVPANVTYTFLRPSGGPVTATRQIPPQSRGTVKVDDEPGMASTDVSTRVTADVPIAVERAMYFNFNGKTGGHDAEGVTELKTDWFLAEGDTRPDFDTYILLANPSPQAADVTLTYATESGQLFPHNVQVAPESRQTIHLNQVVPGQGVSTRIKVNNGVGIAVERAMYFLYDGQWDGGSDAQAVSAPSPIWLFAEGFTTG